MILKTFHIIILLAVYSIISAPAFGQFLMEDENGVVRGWEYVEEEAVAQEQEVVKKGPALMDEKPAPAEVAEPQPEKTVREVVPEKPEKKRREEKEKIRKEPAKDKESEAAENELPEPGPASTIQGAPLRREEIAQEKKRTDLTEIAMAPILAGGVTQWEKSDENQKQLAFDVLYPMGNGNTLRYYSARAEGKTIRTGLEWKHTRANGRFHKWEVTGFSATPQMKDSFGLKYSFGRNGKVGTFAAVRMPEVEAWAYPGVSSVSASQQYVFAASLRKQSTPRFFFANGRLSSYYTIDRTYQMGFIGQAPIGHSLSRADAAPRAALAWTPRRGSVFEIAYVNNIRLGEIAYNIVAVKPHRGGADWLKLLTHSHTGEMMFAQAFRGGELYYRMSTTVDFTREMETVGLKYAFRRDFNLNAEYARNRGYNDFYEVPDKEITRLSLTKKVRKNYEAGLLLEARRSTTFTGFQLYTEGAGGKRLPDTIYRDMNRPEVTFKNDYYADDSICSQINNLADAVRLMKSAYQVAALKSCLNQAGYLQEFYKVAPPWDIINGEPANCISTAWLQAYILNRNGYEAYPIGLQSSKQEFGNIRNERYNVAHAIVAYKRPGWKYWRLMEYNDLVTTTGETIEEALRTYDPSYLGFTVFDPEDLLMLATYDNASFREIDNWIADED